MAPALLLLGCCCACCTSAAINRKVSPIGELAPVGSAMLLAFPNDRGAATRFSWTGGEPVPRVSSTERGLFVAGTKPPPQGFALLRQQQPSTPSTRARHSDDIRGFLDGARDLVYDSTRQLVMVAAIGGVFSVINVSTSQSTLVSTIAPSSVQDAHGMDYDFVHQRAFLASVSQSSVTCIDVSDPHNLRVLSTIFNSTALFYSTHLSYDASRSALFVVSAGNGNETQSIPGHSITSISVADNGTMKFLHRMTSWAPDKGGIPGKRLAYPVYSLLDPERLLMYVSNDARCTLEIIDVSTLVPRKVGNFTDCGKIEYNSQTAYDPATKRLFTVAQHADSFAVFDVANPRHPLLISLLQDQNRTACKDGTCTKAQIFAGATGVAFDAARNLAFVASEYAQSLAVVDLSGLQGFPSKVIGAVWHKALAGEAVQYDAARQRAYVVSRSAAALVTVDVADAERPTVLGVLSSKTVQK